MTTVAARAACLLSACLTVLLAALLMPPWLPVMPTGGLDPSWTAVLSHAFNHGWQFGKDVVFTYGPLSFLATNLFDPDNYVLALTVWLAVAVLVAVTVLSLAEWRTGPMAAGAFLFLLGIRAGVVTPPPSYGQVFTDPLFFVLPLLLLAVYLRQPVGGRWLIAPLIAVVAMSGLIKFTFALLALPIVALIDLHRVTRRRFFPLYLVAFFAFFVVSFALAGQRLTNLPLYATMSLQVASGHTAGLQLPGSPLENTRFLQASAAVLVLAGFVEWRRGSWRLRDWDGVALLSGFALVVFMSLKAGFVRHDIHAVIPWSTLTAAAPIVASRVIRVAPGRRWSLGMLALCVYIAAVGLSMREDRTGETVWSFLNVTFGRGLVDRAAAAVQTVAGVRLPQLREARERALESVRNANPLPPLGGTVDVYPWEAALPLAYGLDYRPRPVFHSYIVYTAPLIERNRRFLQSGAATDKVLFALEPLDNRFPSLLDAEAWPELLARYDARTVVGGGLLLLERRATPRQVTYRDLGSVNTTWFQRIGVPPTSGLVWTSIEINRTAAGALMDILFKVPAADINVQLAGGQSAGYRLVPAIVRDGFVLSPFVDSTAAFAALARGELNSGERRIVAIELRRPGEATSYYADTVRVTFRSLEIQ